MASIYAIGGTGHAVLSGHAPSSLWLYTNPPSHFCVARIRRCV